MAKHPNSIKIHFLMEKKLIQKIIIIMEVFVDEAVAMIIVMN